MISKIVINNFKSIERLELDIKRINVLVGGNNAGKTSILQAIQFGGAIVQTVGITAKINWDKEKNFTRSIEPTELVYSPLKEVSALARGGELKQGEKYTIKIDYFDDLLGVTSVSIKRGKNRNIVSTISKSDFSKRFESIENPVCVFVPGLAGIPYNEEFKTESIVRKAAARGDANGVLRNILWLLKKNNTEWNTFVSELQRVFPNIEIVVSFNPQTDEYIDVKVKETVVITNEMGNKETIERLLPIDAVGTGVLQAIQILSYINVYHPKLLIMDEPDAHLHPDNQRKIIRMIIDLAHKKDYQLILSTHSRHIIDSVQDEAKVIWIKDGMKVNDEDFEIVRVLVDIGALDMGDMLKNGNIKSVVLTEDATERAMLETLLQSSGFNISETDIWSYNGCTKVDAALILHEFIKKHAPSAKVIIHRDRDYLTNDEIQEYVNKITKGGVSYFITKGTDIESHYLSAQHIHAIYPALSISDCEELINEATIIREEYSLSVLTNSRFEAEKRKKRSTGLPDHYDVYKINSECKKIYDSDIVRYRHGKYVYREVKNLLQRKIGGQIDLLKVTDYLSDDCLSYIAKDIWK